MKLDANFVDPFHTTCLTCPVPGGCAFERRDVPNSLCPIESGEAESNPQQISDDYLSLEEAAKFIGVSGSTLRRWSLDGMIVAIRLGVHAQTPYVIPKKYARYAKELVEDGIRL